MAGSPLWPVGTYQARYYDWLALASKDALALGIVPAARARYWLAPNDTEKTDIYVETRVEIACVDNPEEPFRSRVLHAHAKAEFEKPAFQSRKHRREKPTRFRERIIADD